MKEDRPLLSFNLTGYDDEGNYIGMESEDPLLGEEEARRLCEVGIARMIPEDKRITEGVSGTTIPTTLPMYIKPELKKGE